MTMASSTENMFQIKGFRPVLHHISKNLDQNEERGFKFLLRDVLHKKELGKSLQDVFEHLEMKKEITKENIPWVIIDCLQFIGQISLIITCFGEKCIGEHRKEPFHVDPFRRLLYDTGMALKKEEWQSLMFLFDDDVPKSLQEEFQSALDLLLNLEDKRIICKESTERLQDKLDFMERKDLSFKLKEFHRSKVNAGLPMLNTDVGAAPEVNATPEYGRNAEHPALAGKFSIILKDSVVKGIHVNRLNPPVEKQLSVTHEEGNDKDENACIVSVPDSRVRKCRKEGNTRRIVEDISGRTVGYVPRELSKAMRYVLDRDCCIFAVKTGKPCPSFPPWPSMFSIGGGLVLPCNYIINCYTDERQKDVVIKLKEALSKMQGDGGMSVITEL